MQQFVRFIFSFGNDWDGLVTFVQFTQNGNSYNQYLDDDNSAYLPSEIVAGTCTLVLYGSKDKTIATTNYLTLTINDNILISDANSTEISESLYNQLVSRIADADGKMSIVIDGEEPDAGNILWFDTTGF